MTAKLTDEDVRVAADAFRDTLLPKADQMHAGYYPLWHGWALHDAFVAGAAYQAGRRSAAGVVGASLFRKATDPRPHGCYCQLGACKAPRPEWCRDEAKRDGVTPNKDDERLSESPAATLSEDEQHARNLRAAAARLATTGKPIAADDCRFAAAILEHIPQESRDAR